MLSKRHVIGLSLGLFGMCELVYLLVQVNYQVYYKPQHHSVENENEQDLHEVLSLLPKDRLNIWMMPIRSRVKEQVKKSEILPKHHEKLKKEQQAINQSKSASAPSVIDILVPNASYIWKEGQDNYVYRYYDPLKPKLFNLSETNNGLFTNFSNVLCFGHGTNATLSSKGKSCVCVSGWSGAECAIPHVLNKSRMPIGIDKMKIRKSPRRILHAINVNHEVDMSEVRFHELSDVVDVFIICESNYTAFGMPKNLTFLSLLQKGFLKEFQHKIAYIFLDHFPSGGKEDGWVADRYLRTFMGKKALTQIIGYRPDDLIVLADADEIPSSDVLWFLKMYDGYSEPIAFTLRWSYYGFFWKGPNDKHTQVISAATIAYVKYVCDSDLIKLRRPPKQLNSDAYRSAFNRSVLTWTIGPPQGPFAGWHCSWCFPPQGIQTKLISAQNGDFPRWGNFKAKQNLDYIKGLIRDGKYFDGSHPFNAIVTLKSDDFYAPSYVLSNPKRFSYLLHNPYRST